MADIEDIKSQIDLLYKNVSQYRSCIEFKKQLEFCARFKSMSMFNAILIEKQMPGARYVLRANEWSTKYSREIKVNARPLIILVPFGPISFVYDISETRPIINGKRSKSDAEILSEIENPFQTKSDINENFLKSFCKNIELYGIFIDSQFDAATSYAGKIELYNKDYINYPYKKHLFTSQCDYLISINNNAKPGESFATLCHELGHLFCHHIASPYKAWETRCLSHSVEEFEAETVSWLVCERLNIGNPSEKYLASYCSNNEQIPPISIERVFSAVNEIEKMLKSKLSVKKSIKYKYDKAFKEAIDSFDKKSKYKNED